MGCVQGKAYVNSPTRGLEKLKMENAYVKGGRNVDLKELVKESGHDVGEKVEGKNVDEVIGDGGGGGGGGGERNTIGDAGVGSVSKRIVPRKIGEEELVDGWPKWLVDNIPRDALAGLVPNSADSYDKLAKIGQGTYSNVYKAREKNTGKIVALKKVRVDTSEPDSVKFMAREIMMLQKLDHPNIIKLEGLATSRMQYSLYLVFDFMQADLTRVITRPGERLTEPQVKSYMHQLLLGLQHCHERGILHRDIKASNLLIDRSGMLKIADFGLANFFYPNKQKHPLTSRVVTLWYRAPELLLGCTDYGVGIDLWSAGCLLGEMFMGRPIMPGRTEVEQLHKIVKLCGSPPEEYWKRLKQPASFRPPRHYRPSFQETFADFPTSSFGLLTSLLAMDPTNRGTAASALQSEFFSSSPLACELSGLPVMYKEEDDANHMNDRKKRRALKTKQSRANHKTNGRKDPVTETARRVLETNVQIEQSKGDLHSFKETEHAKRDLEFSKEMEKISEQNKSQEMGNSPSSSSSSYRPNRHEENLHASLSPILNSYRKRFPITEAHPNATKNIQNYTLLQASITDIINHNQGNALGRYRRSISTLDFRSFDPEKMSKLLRLDKDHSGEN